MPPIIVVYGSSVSGNLQIKKEQGYMQDALSAKKIPYTFVDIAADSAQKAHLFSVSPVRTLPQLFVDGVYKGGYAEFELAVETESLPQFLGLSIE